MITDCHDSSDGRGCGYSSSGSLRCPTGGVVATVSKTAFKRCYWWCLLGSFSMFLQGPSAAMAQPTVLLDCFSWLCCRTCGFVRLLGGAPRKRGFKEGGHGERLTKKVNVFSRRKRATGSIHGSGHKRQPEPVNESELVSRNRMNLPHPSPRIVL